MGLLVLSQTGQTDVQGAQPARRRGWRAPAEAASQTPQHHSHLRCDVAQATAAASHRCPTRALAAAPAARARLPYRVFSVSAALRAERARALLRRACVNPEKPLTMTPMIDCDDIVVEGVSSQHAVIRRRCARARHQRHTARARARLHRVPAAHAQLALQRRRRRCRRRRQRPERLRAAARRPRRLASVSRVSRRRRRLRVHFGQRTHFGSGAQALGRRRRGARGRLRGARGAASRAAFARARPHLLRQAPHPFLCADLRQRDGVPAALQALGQRGADFRR
jgi:hypothetical protein